MDNFQQILLFSVLLVLSHITMFWINSNKFNFNNYNFISYILALLTAITLLAPSISSIISVDRIASDQKKKNIVIIQRLCFTIIFSIISFMFFSAFQNKNFIHEIKIPLSIGLLFNMINNIFYISNCVSDLNLATCLDRKEGIVHIFWTIYNFAIAILIYMNYKHCILSSPKLNDTMIV